jgi:hypothetical protein
MADFDADKLQDLIFETGSCGGQSFPLATGYEVHPRGEPGADFPPAVQEYLAECGFERHVDKRRGPFYRRPWPPVNTAEV